MSDSNNAPLENETEETKSCSKCFEEKSYCEFNADSRRKDGKRASCKICDAAQKKQIRTDNLVEYRRKNAENNRNHRIRRQGKNILE